MFSFPTSLLSSPQPCLEGADRSPWRTVCVASDGGLALSGPVGCSCQVGGRFAMSAGDSERPFTGGGANDVARALIQSLSACYLSGRNTSFLCQKVGEEDATFFFLVRQYVEQRLQGQSVHNVSWLGPAASRSSHSVADRFQGCYTVRVADDTQWYAQLNGPAYVHIIKVQAMGIHFQHRAGLCRHLENHL